MGTISWEDFEKVELRVVTFRIGDLGFRIENTKTKFKNYLRIPQSAFRNWEPARRVGVRRTNPQLMCFSTPK